MKGSRFSEEQIIGVLREHEAGAKTEEVCRRHGISSATLYKWKSKYGGLEVSELCLLYRRLSRSTGSVDWPGSAANASFRFRRVLEALGWASLSPDRLGP